MKKVLDPGAFSSLVEALPSVDIQAEEEKVAKEKGLFRHVMDDITSMKEAVDIPTADLISLIKAVGFFCGGSSPAKEFLEETSRQMDTLRPIIRRRVL